MQSKYILALVGGIVVVGAVLMFAMSNPKGTDNTEADTSVNEETNDAMASNIGTMRELMLLGKNITCTVRHEDAESGTVVEGTAYIADRGERMSGTYRITMNDGTEMESNIVRTGGWNYMWGDQFDAGVKSEVTEADREQLFPEEGSDVADQPIDPNLIYDCQSWRVDEDVFALPDDVTFMDYSAQLKQMEAAVQGGASVSSQQCGACDLIPNAENKAACLQALGC